MSIKGPSGRNEVFSYAILSSLKNKAAYTNHDSQVSVSELYDYVSKEVESLTKGAQKPTSRRENIENDWRVW
jgi:hypothetical protein